MRRGWRGLLAGLAAILLSPAGALAEDACGGRYQETYAATWRLPQASWDVSCRAGVKPEDILSQAQQAFIAACRARLRLFVEDKRVAEATVWALCAQGRGGEARLEGMFNLPSAASADDAPGVRSARKKPAQAPSAGSRFYSLVRSRGHKYRGTPINGILLAPGIFVAEYHDQAVPPLCKLEFIQYCPRTDAGGCRPMRPGQLTDTGCTGRVEDMKFVWNPGGASPCGEEPEVWTQKDVDAVLNFAADTVDLGCDPRGR